MYSIIHASKPLNLREIPSIKYLIVFPEVKVSRGAPEPGGNDLLGQFYLVLTVQHVIRRAAVRLPCPVSPDGTSRSPWTGSPAWKKNMTRTYTELTHSLINLTDF